MRHRIALIAVIGLGTMLASSAFGSVILYNNLTPNNLIAIATRPGTSSFEIETGDDFVLTNPVSVTSASFVGLFVPGTGGLPAVQDVVLEIYRVFPVDSTVARTSGPPTFSTPQVPTRVNSPSDMAFASDDSATGQLTFQTTVLSSSFTVLNSITPGGIHPIPNQATGGNAALVGQEVEFNVTLTIPFSLPADHYFFVPQVSLSNGGRFYWLSAARPVTAGVDINGNPTTPFPAGFTDLQAWTRDANLDPDWLRVGTDIVDSLNNSTAPTFNAAFSLNGDVVPEPGTTVGVLLGLGFLGCWRWRAITRRAGSPRA